MSERFIVTTQASLVGRKSRLRAIASNALGLVAKAVEQTADDIIQDLVDNYSTAESGPTYVRTGPNEPTSLGGSWERSDAINNGDRLIVVINNDAMDERGRFYASFVQGENQTERHADAGWNTIKEIQDAHAHAQANRVRAAIRRAGNAL